VGLALFIPNGYPYHGLPSSPYSTAFSSKTLQRIDWFGAGMLLAATIFLCTAFEQAGIEFPWRSAFVIAMLVVSGVLWVVFLGWERWVTMRSEDGEKREPVSPWRFFGGRVMVGMLLFVFPYPFPIYRLSNSL
jgi:hypothetical protein